MTEKVDRLNMTVPEEFITTLQKKDFITYTGLLHMGHKIGIKSIVTDLMQIPSAENGNVAIAKAIITTNDDEVFIEFGDAGPNSVNKMIAPHIIRMALTRAKARALRDLCNIGMTSAEEMGGEDNDVRDNSRPKQPKGGGNGTISEAQLNRLYAIAKSKGVDSKTVDNQVQTKFNKHPSKLHFTEYNTVVAGYESVGAK